MSPLVEPRTDGPLGRSALMVNAVGLGMLTAGVAVQLPTAGPRLAAAAIHRSRVERRIKRELG